MTPVLRTVAGLLVWASLTPLVWSQGSVVEPGPNYTLKVNGEPFYPLGWALVGSCLSPDSAPGSDQRASVASELEQMRRFGVNTVMDLPFTSGRLIPYRSTSRWYNWYSYKWGPEGKEREVGHARPGVYVEAMRWLMDQGVQSETDQHIYSFVSITSMIAPGRRGTPHNGSDQLTCSDYRAFIDTEREHVAETDPARARRIPRVDCAGQAERPFWEWNVWYVVRNLRDHPGLLGWYLYDEPEGTRGQELFGLVQPGEPVPAFTGPKSLPTPDLLRYAYNLVKRYETEGRPASYQRHPILVDIYLPDIFFSQRYAWSNERALNPLWHAGPFDRTPEGTVHVPADLLGLDASNQLGTPLAKTTPGASIDELGWWPDPNLTSATSAALRKAAEQDGLWGALAIQAQAHLATSGPYAIAEPLRCTPKPGDRRARLLSDRLLTWQLLTHQVNGLRGQVYYAHFLLPTTGEGAEMERRIDRLIAQFHQANLPSVFATPEVASEETLGPLTIHALTNLYRENPYTLGPTSIADAGRSSAAAPSRPILPDTYIARRFGRSNDPDRYGQPTLAPPTPSRYADHQLLRTSVHRLGGQTYLFVSNAYDARLSADVRIEPPSGGQLRIEEGLFDLDKDDSFRWDRSPSRTGLSAGGSSIILQVDLEPYEARLFRW